MKTCAARRVVGGPQAAVMRCNDGTADGQSHTGPVNLRGKKRIEDLVRLLRGQPYARIADGDDKLLVFRSPSEESAYSPANAAGNVIGASLKADVGRRSPDDLVCEHQ